jgi:hypothetical protein
LPNRPGPTKAFIVPFVPGTFDQLEVVRAAVETASLPPSAQLKAERFVVQLLATADWDGDGFVPFPSKLIEREIRGLDWRPLEDVLVLNVRRHDRHAGRCREFGVADDVRRPYYEAGPTAMLLFEDGLYDLTTGRPTRRRVKSDLRTPSGNAISKFQRGAIDALGEVPVEVHALERHLGQLRAAVDEAEDGDARVAAHGRYMNDLRCYQAVLTQGARPLDPERPDGLWVYRPAYKPQRFGRISQKGGGLQSCSSEMKAVAYPETYP